ncbi:MAG: hypothetical protein CFE39_10775 [Comamonadaceae bacterium PBBC2]|nr:MAG: hypothetical protein CFE39_10775 [Comamonadaceae bacterium PBBC2]
MTPHSWIFPIASIATLLAYGLHLAWRSGRRAQHVHADLRADWFNAVSAQAGTEVLAVQTLRNSVMTATMIASTSALGLMGAISLSAPSLHALLDAEASPALLTPRSVLEFALMALLFTTVVVSAMAVRNYTHAGFVVGMPVDSAARQRWAAAGKSHLRNAGVLYGWGWRCLVLVAPILVSMVQAAAGLAAALLVTGVLLRVERSAVADDHSL